MQQPRRPGGAFSREDAMRKNRQMMKISVWTLLLASLVSSANAASVMPVDGKMDGIGGAQFLGTLQNLGAWRTPAAYQVRLFQAMSRAGGECGVSDADDSDTCPRFTLY